jgi:ATP-dependent RNA helicase DHX36
MHWSKANVVQRLVRISLLQRVDWTSTLRTVTHRIPTGSRTLHEQKWQYTKVELRLQDTSKDNRSSAARSNPSIVDPSETRPRIKSNDSAGSSCTATSNKMALEKPGAARTFLKSAFISLRALREQDDAPFNDLIPRMEFQSVSTDQWSCTITLFYPNKTSFTGIERKKAAAEEEASKKAVEWLQSKAILGYDFKPVAVYEKKKKQNQENKRAIISPLQIEPFGSVQQGLMSKFIEDYNLRHKAILEQYLHNCNEQLRQEQLTHPTKILFDNKEDKSIVNGFMRDPNARYYSIVSGRPVRRLNGYERKNINNYFRNFFAEREEMMQRDAEFARLRNNIKKLPIHKHREQILDTLFENQVVVISGETGSGKTTQIPQFILEDMINAEYGAECCVIVTQPRRLAAISVAEQTAAQFGEGSVGRTFGHHVRFDSVLPSRDNGCVLFCTTGILLRKMAMNPYLIGVTHLIIDEVHEREFLADIIFVLLKKVLEKNKRIFVILMSASLNAEQFSRYFNNCPIIKVDGRLYPVQRHYLDEIAQKVPSANMLMSKANTKVNADVVADLIHHINQTKEGNDSILCFLPGWNDIRKVDQLLSDSAAMTKRRGCNRLTIVPVHSMLNSAQQKEIFKPLESGVRKVILSTNIAETSLTVPDVVYVIDPGLCNEIFYHKELNVSTFGTHWVSQANAKQREGRAGRVKPGVCFKLYSKETESTLMPRFPVPEILRIPLENVIMLSKLYCYNEKIVDFLERTMQSPSSEAIEAAVQTLKSINVLDEDENLTHLGRKIIDFTTHPRLSVCLVNASMLGCIDRMLNLVVMLSNTRDPFDVPPDNRNSLVRQIKTKLSNRYLSDYLALVELLNDWGREDVDVHPSDDSSKYYVDVPDQGVVRYSTFLNRASMESAMNLKKQYTNNLRDNGLMDGEVRKLKVPLEDCTRSKCLLGISLVSGLYPNILKFSTNKKMNQNSTLVDVNTGQPARYTAESVLHNAELKDDNGFNSCSIYFNSFFSEDLKKLMIKDASCIPPLFILLVIGKNIHIHSKDDQNLVVSLDGSKLLTFNVNSFDLELIMQWKEMFYKYQEWYLISEKNESDAVYKYIRRTYLEFVELTFTLFERYANKLS